jgi:pilus assembly protein CpaC
MTTHRNKVARTLAPLPLALAAMLAASLVQAAPPKKSAKPAPAAAVPAPSAVTEIAPQLTLAEGKSTLMRLPFAVARMSVGDPRIADVILLKPTELYLVGKTVGATNLIVWDKAGEPTIIDLAVHMDVGLLQNRLAQVFPGEKTLQVSSAGDAIVLRGTVPDIVRADQVLSVATAFIQRNMRIQEMKSTAGPAALAGQSQNAVPVQNQSQGQSGPKVINMLTIAAPQQVMLEVKVAEISKTLVDQLGASIGAAAARGNWTYTFLSNLLAGKPGIIDAFKGTNGNFLTIDAQKRDGLVKVLAEPTIMSISGQEASFLAGGKVFIPVSITPASGGAPVITLEEKEFGIAVKFTPTVLDGGRINLRVAPEVSDLNKDGVGINAAGVTGTAILPAFTTRRATTTVQLYDGQSFAIGGLIKNNTTTNVKAFPVLGELPVIGALFRSSDFQTDRTELVFIVTPHLVKPLPENYALPTDGYIEPSRADLFLRGKLEGKPPADAPPAPASAPATAPATGFDLK